MLYFPAAVLVGFIVGSVKIMASAGESAGTSGTKLAPSASVHKVKVVSPFISDSGTSSSQDNEEQQVCLYCSLSPNS